MSKWRWIGNKLIDPQGRFTLCTKCLKYSHGYENCQGEESMVVKVRVWKKLTNLLRSKGFLFFGRKARKEQIRNIWIKEDEDFDGEKDDANFGEKEEEDFYDMESNILDFCNDREKVVGDDGGENSRDRKRRKVEGERLKDGWELLGRSKEKLRISRENLESEWDEFEEREGRLALAKENVEEMEIELRKRCMEIERLEKEIGRRKMKLDKELVKVGEDEKELMDRVMFVKSKDEELRGFLEKIRMAEEGKEKIEEAMRKKEIGVVEVGKEGGKGSEESSDDEKVTVVDAGGKRMSVGRRRLKREIRCFFPEGNRVIYETSDGKGEVFRKEVEVWMLGEKSGALVGRLTKEVMGELKKLKIVRATLGVKEQVRIMVEKGKEEIEE